MAALHACAVVVHLGLLVGHARSRGTWGVLNIASPGSSVNVQGQLIGRDALNLMPAALPKRHILAALMICVVKLAVVIGLVVVAVHHVAIQLLLEELSLLQCLLVDKCLLTGSYHLSLLIGDVRGPQVILSATEVVVVATV